MPTLLPGWKVVPRWRTMMLPAGTSWPPKRFTPRRWPGESRPLRELPPAFLCAIAGYSFLAFAAFVLAASGLVPPAAAAFLAGAFFAFLAGASAGPTSAPRFHGFWPSVRVSGVRSTVRSWRWAVLWGEGVGGAFSV